MYFDYFFIQYSMETKAELMNKVKEWIDIDMEIKEVEGSLKQIKAILKTKKSSRDQIGVELINVMKTNEIEGFDINNGFLFCKKIKSKRGVNKSLLLTCLNSVFNDPAKAEEVTKYVLDNRIEVVKEEISKKVAK
jgi:hypothetical protein